MSSYETKVVKKRKLIRKGLYIAVLVKLFLITGSVFKKDIETSLDSVSRTKYIEEISGIVENNSIEQVNYLEDMDAVYIINSSEDDAKYYLKDKKLFKDNEIISLKNFDKPVYLMDSYLDDETFLNIMLKDSKTEELALNSSVIDNNFVNYLPSTVKKLGLSNCNFVTDLSLLPECCPNIETLYIDRMSGLTDLDFIYDLPNLKMISIIDSAYIAEDLINHLNSLGIEHNLTENDILNSQKIDAIIREIIKPDMTDQEKIKSICLYVLDTVNYRSSKVYDSNINPLSCVLEDGGGVCSSYAYLTNVLLTKAGIESFEVTNDKHGWNMVKLDNKYYYIDTTSMDSLGFYKFFLNNFDVCGNYLFDIYDDSNSLISSPKEGVVPMSLILDLYAGKSYEEICNKYNDVLINAAYILHFTSIFMFILITNSIVKNSLEFKSQAIDYLSL